MRPGAAPIGVALGFVVAGCGIGAEGLFEQAANVDASSPGTGVDGGPGGGDSTLAASSDVGATDAASTVPFDAFIEAALDPPDAPAASPDDATAPETSGPPAPIVWDGGAIARPLLSDVDWTSFCVALAACGQFPSISLCMALLRQPTDPDVLVPSPTLVQCVGNAGPSCSAIAQCLNDGSKCKPNKVIDTCSGSSFATCRWGFLMTMDCADVGMVCTAGRANAGCGFGDCALSQEGASYCAGRFVVKCDRGRYTPTLDCTVSGATCGGAPGAARCEGSGPPCPSSAAGVSTCRGASIDTCLGGRVASTDCLALYDPSTSFTCVTDPASPAPRCGLGTACDPATYGDTCSGPQTATYCNAGAVDTYDCSQWASGCKKGFCSNN